MKDDDVIKDNAVPLNTEVALRDDLPVKVHAPMNAVDKKTEISLNHTASSLRKMQKWKAKEVKKQNKQRKKEAKKSGKMKTMINNALSAREEKKMKKKEKKMLEKQIVSQYKNQTDDTGRGERTAPEDEKFGRR